MSNLRSELSDLLDRNVAFDLIWNRLRALKEQGIAREEVQLALESLRSEAVDEIVEDRILSAIDCVVGYCTTDKRIWDN